MKVEHVPLSRILTPQLERTTVDTASEYPIAGVLGFGRGLLLREAIRGTETQYTFLSQIHEGQVVYSKVKAFEGAFTIVNEAGDGRFVSPEFPVFDVAENVSDSYIRHFLASDRFMSQIQLLSSGIGARRERVSPTRFLSIEIPLPSASYQRRIAAHLDSVEQTQVTLRAAHDRRREHADALSRGLWRSISGDSIPLGEALHPSREPVELEDDKSYVAIGMKSFGKGLIEYPPARAEQLSKLRYFHLSPDRLVLSNIKAWEGAVGMTGPHEGGRIASNRFLQMELTREGSLSYIRHWLLSSAGIHALNVASPGSADRNRTLSLERLQSIPLPWPEASAQNRLADLLDAATKIAHEQRSLVLAEALLPAARNEVFNALQ